MKEFKYSFGILAVVLLIYQVSCSEINSQEMNNGLSQEFKDYWYAGQGELNRYQLQQVRYGEVREGDAVLIFVTEDFLTDKQVKYESGQSNANAISVLKLNLTRKFLTGIYPYSMMTSVFTPVGHQEPTLKVTTSSQEWCGHAYSQLNLKSNRYEGILHSYFQEEADREFNLEQVLLEDEIWARIRLDPSKLPTGEIRIIPGTQFQRLSHRETEVEIATASIDSYRDKALSSQTLTSYQIDYRDFGRILKITFESDFPYEIVAWEEQAPGDPASSEMLITRATRTHSLKSPYWRQHSLADTVLRKELGLKQ